MERLGFKESLPDRNHDHMRFGNPARIALPLHPAPPAGASSTAIPTWIWIVLAVAVILSWAFALSSRG
jgi:hypothetical protein